MMTSTKPHHDFPAVGIEPRPADIADAYACSCGRHMGPGWTPANARVAMTQKPGELLGRDAAGNDYIVPAGEAAFWRWWLEAPRPYRRLLQEAGDEAQRRTDGSEPSPADADALTDALVPWLQQRYAALASAEPGLVAWMRDQHAAWLARMPAEPD